MSKLRLVLLTIVAVLLLSPEAAAASVATTPAVTPAVNGTVYAVAQVGSRLVIGGEFTTVGGLARRNAAAILPDGTVDPTFDPSPDGVVRAVAGSADGGTVYLGGTFATAGGLPRTNLVAVDAATGAARDTWTTVANNTVYALTVSGDRLYAGGAFTNIGGVARRRLAAVNVTTGAVISSFNPWPDWTVKAVAVSPDGTKVYATGGFVSIGGARRPGAAEVLASTGQATAFAPTDGGIGLAVALSPDGSRFFFSTTNNRLWAYDPAVSNSPTYVIQTGGDTQAIAASATELYFGGHFNNISSQRVKRNRIASASLATGAITSWNPGSNGYMGVWALATTPDSLLVGGDFTRIGGKARSGVARFVGTP